MNGYEVILNIKMFINIFMYVITPMCAFVIGVFAIEFAKIIKNKKGETITLKTFNN